MCVIRSMYTDIPAHEVATVMMNTGSRQVRPSIGSWVLYGLGIGKSKHAGLYFVAAGRRAAGRHGELAVGVSARHLSGREHQHQNSHAEPDDRKHPQPVRPLAEQRRQLDLIHNSTNCTARTCKRTRNWRRASKAFEIAFKMQTEATDAFDLGKEPPSMRELYGRSAQGHQMLIARRLLERGVRFVQVWAGGWDHHQDFEERLPERARDIDQPLAAFITDLKQRNLFDDTLVIWGGEFGRTPTRDRNGDANPGRDHNAKAFSTGWPAAASEAAWSMAPPTNSARRPSRTRFMSTICTPPFLRCSALTTTTDLPLQWPRFPANGNGGRSDAPGDRMKGGTKPHRVAFDSQRALLLALWAVAGASRPVSAADMTPSQSDFFENKIRPMLADHCYKCHSSHADKLKGGLLLDSREALLKGGDNGPAIVPGDPEASLLIKAVRYMDPDLQMPKDKKLPDDEIADLVAWVKMGAPDPRSATADQRKWTDNKTNHWAWQPVKRVPVPEVSYPDWCQTPVDDFILAKLDESGLQTQSAGGQAHANPPRDV